MARVKSTPDVAGGLAIRPGFYLILDFAATGGKTYRQRDAREESRTRTVDGDEITTLTGEFTTDKHVDCVEVVKNSTNIVGAAHYQVEKIATKTPIGPFVDEGQLAELEIALAPLVAAARLNDAIARKLGSARRTSIKLFPIRVSVDNEAVARRLAAGIRERLGDIRAALLAGDRKAFEAEIILAKNLHRLATGIQADAIRFALEAAKVEKGELLDRIRHGAAPADAGAACNVEALDAAINHFADPGDEVEAAPVVVAPEVEEVDAGDVFGKAPPRAAKAGKGKAVAKGKAGKGKGKAA